MEDEYVDYSCSTPLERLARDVESQLRSWHLVGADRHVSFHHFPSAMVDDDDEEEDGGGDGRIGGGGAGGGGKMRSSGSMPALQLRRRESTQSSLLAKDEKNGVIGVGGVGGGGLRRSTSVRLPSKRRDLGSCASSSSGRDRRPAPAAAVRLIRSADVTFVAQLPPPPPPPSSSGGEKKNVDGNAVVGGTKSGRRVSIDMVLSLWDGPHSPTTSGGRGSSGGLPLSLRRHRGRGNTGKKDAADDAAIAETTIMPEDLASNLCTLFEINQHLTLSLRDPNADGPRTLASSVLEGITSSRQRGRRRRRRDEEEERTSSAVVALNALTSAVQNALNCATAECRCRVPAFGLWGVYDPERRDDAAFGTDHVAVGGGQSSSSGKEGAGSKGGKRSGGGGGTTRRGGSKSTKRTADMECDFAAPSWLVGGSSFDFDPGSGWRRDPSDGPGQRRALPPIHASPRPKKNRGTISLFRPSFSDRHGRRPEPQFLPPVLSGTCHPAAGLDGAGGTFRLHYVPPGTEVPGHCASLNSLGRLLLSHCSRDRDGRDEDAGDDYGKVVVSAARHRYRWIKGCGSGRNNNNGGGDGFDDGTEWRDAGTTSSRNAMNPLAAEAAGSHDALEHYRRECRSYASHLLEDGAVDVGSDEPHWGPSDDPVSSVNVSATWDAQSTTTTTTDGNASVVAAPLLTLPLRIRSHRSLSPSDLLEMERTIQNATFDPTNAPSGSFIVQIRWDPTTASKTLSARNRCVLAALVRADTLDPNAIPGHLANPAVLREMHADQIAYDDAAAEICDRSNVGKATRKLADVMDWSSMADALVDDREIDRIVRNVLETTAGLGFPSPPEEAFAVDANGTSVARRQGGVEAAGGSGSGFEAFPKSAPAGRLLSVLLTHMARLRTPASMAALWLAFVTELRCRWDRREGLPNMLRVPGIDDVYNDGDVGGTQRKATAAAAALQKRKVGTLGGKAEFAAFVNSSEPDPKTDNVLICQKLRVFNIGIECTVALEALQLKRYEAEQERLERLAASDASEVVDRDDDGDNEGEAPSCCAASVASTEVMNNVGGGAAGGTTSSVGGGAGGGTAGGDDESAKANPNSVREPQSIDRSRGGGASSADRPDEIGEAPRSSGGRAGGSDDDGKGQTELLVNATPPSRRRSGDSEGNPGGRPGRADEALLEALSEEYSASTATRDEFLDAMDEDDANARGGTDDEEEDGEGPPSPRGGAPSRPREEEAATNVAQRQGRRGARCPVFGASLVASGDQLYAPYLQRPEPLTDDAALRRKAMLSSRGGGGGGGGGMKGKNDAVRGRIAIAQRLQRPQLLSDMSSFKAANPGAVFQDFVNWYGNPGNPLEEYEDSDDDDVGKGGDDDDFYTVATAPRSAAEKLDAASEAIQILTSTRTFWSDAWDDAVPVPAVEQEPLFDAPSVVEMVLHEFETMHPAILIDQALAMNLAMSNFVLAASAGDARNVRLVDVALQRLGRKTKDALLRLAEDVTANSSFFGGRGGGGRGADGGDDDDGPPRRISEETLSACEAACDAIADAETLLSRAATLLHKFPGEHDLVQRLLRKADGDVVAVDAAGGRRGILNAVRRQQRQEADGEATAGTTGADDAPRPSMREYVLRNRDDENPCQLTVRVGGARGSERDPRRLGDGGLLLALSKCERG